MRKEKTTVAETAAKSTGIGSSYAKAEAVGGVRLKVTVNIPDKVQNRQGKINRIYDILKLTCGEEAAQTKAV